MGSTTTAAWPPETQEERTMKNLNLSLLALVLLAAPAAAQTNLYDTHNLSTTCVANPYQQRGYNSQPVPTTNVVPALFESYVVRFSIAQGSVGTPSGERAYLIVSNLEPIDQQVAVRLTVEGIPCPLKWEGTVPASGRAVLGLHADPTLVGKPWNFSAVVYFSLSGGDVDLANYDNAQRVTLQTPGKLVPR
jgi:hypothetical protein